MKRVKVDLSGRGIDGLINELERFKQETKAKTLKFIDRMAEMGAVGARARFGSALYAGDNDVLVKIENRQEGAVAVVATGHATLFIEFGTGVVYWDDHPAKPAGLKGRGEYGKGYGQKQTWWYHGEPGNLGVIRRQTDKGPLVTTHGNPANRCMYDTVKELEDAIRSVAREVFG